MEHYLSFHLSACPRICVSGCDINSAVVRDNMTVSSCGDRPVSLVVILVLIRAHQLVGAGLVSQQAEVLERRGHISQVFQQGFDISQVSKGGCQGPCTVNYISIYCPRSPSTACLH